MKTNLGRFFLARIKSPSRKRKGVSLHTAKEVWVVGLIRNMDEQIELHEVMDRLRGYHGVREVKLITFAGFTKKTRPEWYVSSREHIAIAKHNLNWKGLPEEFRKDLSKAQPELLLDLIKERSTPLEWVWKMIPAQMKVTTEKSNLSSDSDLLLTCDKVSSLSEVFAGYEEILTKYNLK